jgi:RNA polymerase sigma factor (sigma-70 family)
VPVFAMHVKKTLADLKVDWERIDWEKVARSLFVRTRFMVSRLPVVFDSGVSVEDIIQEALVQFFDSPNALGWNPEVSSLESFLAVIVERRLIDHLRRDRRATSIDAPTFKDRRSPTAQLEIENPPLQAQIIEQLAEATSNNDDRQEVKTLFKAALQTSEVGNVNKQLADILGTTTTQIAHLKRRLQRRLKSRGVRDSET